MQPRSLSILVNETPTVDIQDDHLEPVESLKFHGIDRVSRIIEDPDSGEELISGVIGITLNYANGTTRQAFVKLVSGEDGGAMLTKVVDLKLANPGDAQGFLNEALVANNISASEDDFEAGYNDVLVGTNYYNFKVR